MIASKDDRIPWDKLERSQLELSFATSRIRDLCERREEAVSAMGLDAALELEQRLADIEAVDNAADLIALLSNEMAERSSYIWSLRLSSGHTLVLVSGHAKRRHVTSGGATDWGRVTRMRIEEIEGPNG